VQGASVGAGVVVTVVWTTVVQGAPVGAGVVVTVVAGVVVTVVAGVVVTVVGTTGATVVQGAAAGGGGAGGAAVAQGLSPAMAQATPPKTRANRIMVARNLLKQTAYNATK